MICWVHLQYGVDVNTYKGDSVLHQNSRATTLLVKPLSYSNIVLIMTCDISHLISNLKYITTLYMTIIIY
jgi:hypothetical protein